MERRLRHPDRPSAVTYGEWRERAVQRLTRLLGLPLTATPGRLAATDAPSTEPQLITLTTAEGEVPAWLLVPPPAQRLDAAVVAVAGHGLGIDALVETAPDADDFHGGLAHKLAAAGFTVLCPEMISFGRRRTPPPPGAEATENSCQVDAMHGLLTGRPVLGRRVADALAAVAAARTLDWIDPAKVAVAGGSSGGAVAMITAALDDRIPAALVATYLSSFADSVCAVPHCICNAVPDLLTWFEMADLAALIAPRQLIIEAGRDDPIFPITATTATHAELTDLWSALSADPPDLVITETSHRFLADDAIAHLRRRVLAATPA